MWEQAVIGLNKLVKTSKEKPSEDAEDASKTQLMDDIELANTTIFSIEDFLLYRAIIKFYLKQYSAAQTVPQI